MNPFLIPHPQVVSSKISWFRRRRSSNTESDLVLLTVGDDTYVQVHLQEPQTFNYWKHLNLQVLQTFKHLNLQVSETFVYTFCLQDPRVTVSRPVLSMVGDHVEDHDDYEDNQKDNNDNHDDNDHF